MTLADVLREQAIDKFKHCYVRYQALLAQLHAEAGVVSPPPGASDGSNTVLLQHLLAAAGGSSGLAAALAAHRLAPSSGGLATAGFEHSYAQEVERLRLFVKSILEQLWLALLDECAQLRGLSEELLQAGVAAAGHSRQLDARLEALRGGFDTMANEVVLVERFVRQNVSACAQLAQMYDQQQWQGSELPLEAVEGDYLGAAHAALLGDLRLEPLVVGLSDAYELCRLVESDAAALVGQSAQWVPPDKFQRVTRKFWLHPMDVMQFKVEVIRHLPVLIFGDRTKLTEGSPYQVAFLRDQGGLSDSAEVSSVYYDDAALSSYHDRLRKDDHASVVRLRWYGERFLSPDQCVFVERKVHRERYTGELSFKERAPMAQRYVADYTRGGGGPPEMAMNSGSGGYSQPQVDFLRDTQRFLVQRGQEPLLRTCYLRAAFQESSNNQVRISLDTQLHMVGEVGAPRAAGDWCRDMGAPLAGAADAAYFPYAVVEIKLQAVPPDWLQGLLQTGMLLPVPKFSKFLHGAAMLFQHACRNVPYWFLPDEVDPSRMSPATWEEMADPADEYLQKGASWLFPTDFNAHLEPEPAEPYRPSPLRFLRRNKTAPAAATAGNSGSSLSSGVGGGGTPGGLMGAHASGGGNRQASAAACPAESAVLWQDLLVAGGTLQPSVSQPPHPSLLPPPHVQHQQHQTLLQGHLRASASASAAALLVAGTAASGGQTGAVTRTFTWPVYQNPLALLPPSPGPHPGSRPSVTAPQPLLLHGGGAAAAAAAEPVGRPSPAHSQTSTPIDSAQDLEAGQGPEAGTTGKSSSGGKGSRGGGKHAGVNGGMVGASALAALQNRPPAAAPGGNGSCVGAASSTARALVRTRVEPKTFFANERTFLQWLQISVLIMMTAVSLLSGTGMLSSAGGGSGSGGGNCDSSTDKACFASKLSGAIIAPVALLFMAYALFMYKKRTYQILRRETVRYDDQRGPAVLVAILLAVFILSYVLALVFIF